MSEKIWIGIMIAISILAGVMIGQSGSRNIIAQTPASAEIYTGRYQLKTVTFWPTESQGAAQLDPVGKGTILFDTETALVQYPVLVNVNGIDVAIGAEVKDQPTYQIVPNAKGGCFVMDPTNGMTYYINSKGDAYSVLDNMGLYYSGGEIIYK